MSEFSTSFCKQVLRWFGAGLSGAALLGVVACDKKSEKKAASSVVSISLPPMPPPPPPPPPPPKQQEEPEPTEKQEMIAQEPVAAEEPPPQAPADEPAPLGTNVTGDGPDSGYGLKAGGGGGGGNGTGKGLGGKGGSRFGSYAGKVQNTIASALRSNSKTRTATFSGKIAIWADSTGRITRVKLDGSTGDAAVDQAIRNEVINGLQLHEGPPSDMPMPIHMRINGRKAN